MTLAFQDAPSLAGKPATPAVPAASGAGTALTTQPTGAPPGAEVFWIFISLLLGMVLLSTFSSRKQKKQKEKLLSGLKKHDRVITTGGMIGYVAEVKPDVVVLKVEEGRDVRITFTRDSIAAVVQSAAVEESAAADDKAST